VRLGTVPDGGAAGTMDKPLGAVDGGGRTCATNWLASTSNGTVASATSTRRNTLDSYCEPRDTEATTSCACCKVRTAASARSGSTESV